MFFVGEHGSNCFEVNSHVISHGYNWQLGPCHASYQPYGIYTDNCCVPNGDHWFSCNPSLSKWNDGGVVKIGKHQFCDDFVGYNQFIMINITGSIADDFSYSYI